MTTATYPYVVPRSGSGLGASTLALLMHVLLALFLFLGINWQSRAPAVVEAELWSAAPRIEVPPPPAPVEDVAPPPAPIVHETLPPEPVHSEIQVKVKPPEKPKPIHQPKPVERVPAKPIVAPPVIPSDIRELQKNANPISTPQPPALASAPIDGGYRDRLIARILSHRNFVAPIGTTGNPTAAFDIEQLPTGEVTSVRITKQSGLPAFDAAVGRAIQDSSPLPKPESGKVERVIHLTISLF